MFVDFNILNQLGSPSINSNTFANRPSAGQVGRLFVSTDTFEIYRDNGTGWDLIGGPGSSTVTGSGAAGQVTYWTGTNSVGGENNLWWDAANNHFGINTSSPGVALDVHSAADVGMQLNGTGATPSILQEFLSAGVSQYQIGYNWNSDINYRRFSIYDVQGAKEVISIDQQSRFVGINYQYSSLSDQPAYTLDVSGSVRATDYILSDYSINSKQVTSSGVPTGYSGFYSNSVTNSVNWINGTTGNGYLFIFPTGISQLTIPNNSGTIALLSDIPSLSGYVPNTRTIEINGTSYDLSTNRTWNVGTVTSVAALTLGTIGTDISSSVANSTTTPVITLNVPTASATNRGALSSTDWNIFNNKQDTVNNAAATTTNITLNGFPVPPTQIFSRSPSINVQGLDGTLYDFGSVYGEFLSITLPTTATSIDFGNVTGILAFPAYNTLQNITANSLLYIRAGLSIGNNVNLTLNLPNLRGMFGNFSISSTSLTNLNFPQLTIINGNFSLSTWSAVNIFSFPELTTLGGQINIIGTNTNITNYSFPKLKNIFLNSNANAITINNATVQTLNLSELENIYCTTQTNQNVLQLIASNLTTINLSKIKNILQVNPGSVNIIQLTTTPNLTTFDIGTSLLRAETVSSTGVGLNVGNFNLSSCALNQTSVDNILVQLAKLDGTGGTTLLSNRTITITGTSATPSATGLAAKATLVARGCTVTTN